MREGQRGGEPLIGVLGATGAVGGPVAGALSQMGLGRLRLGARRGGTTVPVALDGVAAEKVTVSADDAASLARFCAGCRVVVNCAAPDRLPRGTVAATALAAGADYVDPGGDDGLRARLAGNDALAARTALFGAGVEPGLSGLVPRWLATRDLAPPLVLTAYIGTFDRMTPASAREFLLTLADGQGEANALWRAGARHSRALEPIQDTELPFFPGPVVAYPYLSAEAERLARSLPLDEASCYYVFEAGGTILAVLSRLQDQLRHGIPADVLAGELISAADIEMFGRTPVQQLVFQLDGRSSGRPASRVAVLRAASTYELTATVTALATAEILAGAVPAGLHSAAEALDPRIVGGLRGRPGLAALHELDRPLHAYSEAERGVL